MIGGLAADRSPCPEGHLPTDVPDRLPAVRAEVVAAPPPPPGPVLFTIPASRTAGG
jgi:hypothetical protein